MVKESINIVNLSTYTFLNVFIIILTPLERRRQLVARSFVG